MKSTKASRRVRRGHRAQPEVAQPGLDQGRHVLLRVKRIEVIRIVDDGQRVDRKGRDRGGECLRRGCEHRAHHRRPKRATLRPGSRKLDAQVDAGVQDLVEREPPGVARAGRHRRRGNRLRPLGPARQRGQAAQRPLQRVARGRERQVLHQRIGGRVRKVQHAIRAADLERFSHEAERAHQSFIAEASDAIDHDQREIRLARADELQVGIVGRSFGHHEVGPPARCQRADRTLPVEQLLPHCG